MRFSSLTRLGFCLVASALALALGAGPVYAGKAKKVRTEVEIEWFDGAGAQVVMFGDVHSRKNKCERNREVTLTVGEMFLGIDTTDRTGDWEIPTDLEFNDAFIASVEKRTIGKGAKKLVCKGAESPPIVFEP
jgi:hypothetical protein